MCGEILNPKLLFLKCKLQWFAHFPSKCIYQYLNMISFASRNVFSATNWKAEKNGIPPWDSIIVLELDASKKRTPSIVVTRLRKQPPPQFAIFPSLRCQIAWHILVVRHLQVETPSDALTSGLALPAAVEVVFIGSSSKKQRNVVLTLQGRSIYPSCGIGKSSSEPNVRVDVYISGRELSTNKLSSIKSNPAGRVAQRVRIGNVREVRSFFCWPINFITWTRILVNTKISRYTYESTRYFPHTTQKCIQKRIAAHFEKKKQKNRKKLWRSPPLFVAFACFGPLFVSSHCMILYFVKGVHDHLLQKCQGTQFLEPRRSACGSCALAAHRASEIRSTPWDMNEAQWQKKCQKSLRFRIQHWFSDAKKAISTKSCNL